MGENLPQVGERVTWHGDGGELQFVTVIAVHFWDLIDIQLDDGPIIRGVRRVVEILDNDGDVEIVNCTGRFQRMK